jgi:polyisoprenoid-binding protein YceI
MHIKRISKFLVLDIHQVAFWFKPASLRQNQLIKTMKKEFFAASIVMLTLASCGGETAPTSAPTAVSAPSVMKGDATLTIDATSSKLLWKGEMLGLYSHNGQINFTSGKVNLKDGKIISGEAVIDMNSIKPLDDAYEATGQKTKEGLVGHLSSPDFFDIANNPTASFAITSISGNSGKGNLTLRSTTLEETIQDIVITPQGESVKINGSVTFDRTKYGVKFAMPVKEKVLSNDIIMNFEIVAKK